MNAQPSKMMSLSSCTEVNQSFTSTNGTSISVAMITMTIMRLSSFISDHLKRPVKMSRMERKNSFIMPHIRFPNAINTASRVPRCRTMESSMPLSCTFMKCRATDK